MNAGWEPDGPDTVRKIQDRLFLLCLWGISAVYVILILALLLADATYTSPRHLLGALNSPEIRYAIKLSLISCTLTTILFLWASVPIRYLLSRYPFTGKNLVDAILDIPIVLPPLVDRLEPVDPVPDTGGAARGAGDSGYLRRAQRDPGAIHGGLRIRGADDAGHLRANSSAAGTGGADARMQPQPGVLDGASARGATGALHRGGPWRGPGPWASSGRS